ncbi:type IV pilus modification PilV family protein [Acidisoma sp. 7E03]
MYGKPVRRSEAGFTLLEVLVAFVIASLFLAVLVEAGLTGIGSAQLSDRYQEALARAQSYLAALSAQPQPQDRQGEAPDGFHWRLHVVERAAAPIASSDLAHPRGQAVLYQVIVTVSWGQMPRRQVTLAALQVGVQPPGRGP